MRISFFTTTAAALAIGLTLAPQLGAEPAQAQTQSPAADRLVLPAPKPGHVRPLVAVVAANTGAETTDFMVPYGVLKDSNLFDVRAVATAAGPVQLMMSIRIQPDQTTAAFDAAAPEGADIVVVPAQMNPKDPALAAWVRAQAAKGATLVSICEGARVLVSAGLLDGRRATTHWHAMEGLEKAYPRTSWVRDRRYVQDGPIVSTTGVTASIPVSLALVEAAGGHAAADGAARRLGVADWSARHRTANYQISKADYVRAASSIAAVWTHETVEIPLHAGEDEVALALRADTWSRSFRSKVVTTSASFEPVRARHGLMIVPDSRPQPGRFVVPDHPGPAVARFDAALTDLGKRYGPFAVRLAKLGLEYDPPAQVAAR